MNKIKYAGIISLGTFCQMGSALWRGELKNISSPFDNFGIKSWTSVAPILRNRFADYWQLENMGIGKQVFEMANKYDAKRDIIKAYDNKYNVVSNHNFLVEDGNTTEELVTYPVFRKKLRRLEEIFLKQCALYRKIRFVIKAADWPAEHGTIVTPEQVIELIEALRSLRGDKAFDLVIAVPSKQFARMQEWASDAQTQEEYPELLRVTEWKIALNMEKHPEWDAMLGDCCLDENHLSILMNDIVGDPNASTREIVAF